MIIFKSLFFVTSIIFSTTAYADCESFFKGLNGEVWYGYISLDRSEEVETKYTTIASSYGPIPKTGSFSMLDTTAGSGNWRGIGSFSGDSIKFTVTQSDKGTEIKGEGSCTDHGVIGEKHYTGGTSEKYVFWWVNLKK